MTDFHENLITPDEARTLDGLFARRVHRSAGRPAYCAFDRDTQEWITYSWGEMAQRVARWQRALAGESLQPGDRVAIQLRNGPEWVMFDQAALSLGLVVVPLYTDDRPENLAYILEDAAVRLVVVQDAGRWRRLAGALPAEGCLSRVVVLDDGPEGRRLAAREGRIRLGSDWLPADGGELRVRRDGDPHGLASIVYTSGTTGRPKGVMLSHHNMLSVGHASLTILDCYEQDVFLSFLPLSHTLERTGGYYVPMLAGAMVAYARSIGQLANDLQSIRPTVLIAVPRIFERVYGRVKEQLRHRPPLARRLFDLAVAVGWRRFLWQQGRARWSPRLLWWPLLDRLVASKITARLGGRLRVAVSGGAPLSPEIARIFLGLGVPLLQGYGLTETSPVISVNPLRPNIPESVGVPIRGVEVRIGENQEILVRGPGVMLGYWNNHAATAEVIDGEGWFHTGDQGYLDETDHLYITGRLKDILVLSNGEKISPADMEMAIALDPLIEQVLVVGEGRPYLAALVVLDGDHWPGLAQDLGLDPMRPESLASPALEKAVLRHIAEALRGFPGYAKIRRVSLMLEPWTIENGLLTPTLKVKRAKVLERFADRVEALYAGGPTG